MTLPNDPLELAILLHREVGEQQINGRLVEGTLPVGYDFEDVLARLDASDLRGPASDPATRRFEFSLPAHFYLTVDELLRAPARRIQPPERFYVAELGYVFSAGSADLPPVLQAYLDATHLFGLLRHAADHASVQGSEVRLFFLQAQKLEITPAYTQADLTQLPQLVAFERDFVQSEIHRQQKVTILRTVLFELFKGQSQVTFGAVLAHFADLAQQFHDSYQLYVTEFSFQKIKAAVEREKLDFIAKLNKVFSDIQNQLLAIPVALILVAGQMESQAGWAAKNLLIWAGALVFSLLMDLLIRNQRNTLEAIHQEIGQQQQLIQEQHRSVAGQFISSFTQLQNRYTHQCRLLSTLDVLVAFSLAVATGMLLWYSLPG